MLTGCELGISPHTDCVQMCSFCTVFLYPEASIHAVCYSSCRLTAAPTAPTVAPVPQHAPANLAPSLRALSTTLPESSQGPFQVRGHSAAFKIYCCSKQYPCTQRDPAESLFYENVHALQKILRKLNTGFSVWSRGLLRACVCWNDFKCFHSSAFC